MNWIARVFTAALVRRLAYLLVFFAFAFVARCAHAQSQPHDYSNCTNVMKGIQANDTYCRTKFEAEQWAKATMEAYITRNNLNGMSKCGPVYSSGYLYYRIYGGDCNGYGTQFVRAYDVDQCPGGQPDPDNPSECMTTAKCLAQNASFGDGMQNNFFKTRCQGGCVYSMVSGTTKFTSTVGVPNASGVIATVVFGNLSSGKFQNTGDTCDVYAPQTPQVLPNGKPEPTKANQQAQVDKDYCAPIAGQTACMQTNGDLCATASTGRRLCWHPGETGTKTDGNTMQVSKPGIQPGASSVALSNGDTATKTGDVAVQQSRNDSANSNTTISNYTTTSGANAGSTNQGQDATSTGEADPNGSKGDKNGNSAGGGGDCGSPPVCSGDAIECAQLQQTWLARCDDDKRAKSLADQANGLDKDQGDSAANGKSLFGSDSNDYSPDESGLGFGHSCPTAPKIAGHQLDWSQLCTTMGMLGLLILAVAHWHAYLIIAGD